MYTQSIEVAVMRRLVGIFLVLMIACSGAFADEMSAEEMFLQGDSYLKNGDYDNAKIWWQKAVPI